MGTENTTILTVNAGSSSIKLVLFNTVSLQALIQTSISNIGQPSAALHWHDDSGGHSQPIVAPDYQTAIGIILEHLADKLTPDQLHAIGHRVVHGGPDYDQPVELTVEVVDALRKLSAFDPEHLPAALELIEIFRLRFPDVPQIACFDTEFYHDLPRLAKLLPLPRKYESLGLRRYGFHGLSYTYLLDDFKSIAGLAAANGRVIIAHLGSGASLTAIKDGKPVDTTMSFTPASGIPMSTRSGDIDPGIMHFLSLEAGMDSNEFNHMVNFESGLLGVSGKSPDMYTLLQSEADDDFATDAVNLFCYAVKKAIGALSTTIGGLDSLIFAGGIGENAPLIRSRVCGRLEYLGIMLDEGRNQESNFLISSVGSQVGVHVMRSDEAAVIAKQVVATMSARHPEGGVDGLD